MAKERKQKLKVFRTPIGFHDAYVAAPSQKAALEAWGADSNIFAQGIAEQVTDPKLTEDALANPGKVIKKVRGSADEHFAELERAPASKKAGKADSPSPQPSPARRERGKKPSREELDAADEALEQERRELQRRNEAERDKLTDKRDRAKAAYDHAMQKWRDG